MNLTGTIKIHNSETLNTVRKIPFYDSKMADSRIKELEKESMCEYVTVVLSEAWWLQLRDNIINQKTDTK